MFVFDFDCNINCAFQDKCLSKEQWLEFIRLSVNKITKKPVGKLLIDKLENFVKSGCIIQITNKPLFNNIYPATQFVSENIVKICIPSIPYFISIPVVKKCNELEQSIKSISNYICVSKPLDLSFSDYTNYITWEILPKFIELAHELIHTLRHFEKCEIVHQEEECNVIYGLDKGVLKYVSDKIDYITENMIRKEWNIPARLSHDSKELFIYNVPYTFENKDMFDNNSYFIDL